MIILVNGLMGYGAGKTSLVRAILSQAREAGDDFLALKPRSAHNYWEHYDHSRWCQEAGLLVSRDARLLHELSRDPPDLPLVNPYHQLVCPMDALRLKAEEEHMLGGTEEGILAERLTEGRGKSTLFVNKRAHLFVAPPEFLDRIQEGADTTVAFHTSPVAEGLAPVEDRIREVFEGLSRKRENLILESHSDAIYPLRLGSDEVDLIVAVGGSIVLLFDPPEVTKARAVVGGQSMAGLLRYIKPVRSFRVPHLTSEERMEESTLRRAFAEVLKVLWA